VTHGFATFTIFFYHIFSFLIKYGETFVEIIDGIYFLDVVDVFRQFGGFLVGFGGGFEGLLKS
jgi:hypothetical protein